jgi:hypothetical protein
MWPPPLIDFTPPFRSNGDRQLDASLRVKLDVPANSSPWAMQARRAGLHLANIGTDNYYWRENRMNRHSFGLAKMAIVLLIASVGCQPARNPAESAVPSDVTAIDVLIDPDEIALGKARAANERLRSTYAAGFALDETHQPHITCLQRFVKTSDLPNVYAAIDTVLADENPTTWELKAYKYYYIPFNELGLAGIVVEPSEDLVRFQKRLIAAIEPYTVDNATSSAFVTTPNDPEINAPTIAYVRKFVPAATGEKFNPHVTIGLAPESYLKEMLAEDFEAFTFFPSSVSVYQLGDLGTAQKKLKGWELER